MSDLEKKIIIASQCKNKTADLGCLSQLFSYCSSCLVFGYILQVMEAGASEVYSCWSTPTKFLSNTVFIDVACGCNEVDL